MNGRSNPRRPRRAAKPEPWKKVVEEVVAYEEFAAGEYGANPDRRGSTCHRPLECSMGKTLCNSRNSRGMNYICPHFVNEEVVEGKQLSITCSRVAVRDQNGVWISEDPIPGIKPVPRTTRYSIALGK